MRFRTRYITETPQANLVPLVDIVFQLLLFFMVAVSFASLPSLQIDLPESTSAEEGGAAGFTISLKDGGLFLNGEPSDEAALRAFAGNYRVKGEARAEIPVEVAADENCKTQAVIAVFDILRQSGFSLVNLRTEEKSGEH